MAIVLHWFRRDLRLVDNTALTAAGLAGDVLPVFVLDPGILERADTGAARVAFLYAGLRALDTELRARGSRLIIGRGEPASVLREIARRSGAAALYFNRDYEPYATIRDARVTNALQADGLAVRTCKDDVVAELGELPGPRPFRVFTPFYRAWLTRSLPDSATPGIAAARFLAAPAIESHELPARTPLEHAVPDAGHRAAVETLDRFVDAALVAYARDRDRLDGATTSRISPYLRFGMISVRACLRAARRHPGAGSEAWLRQLAWRDFYRQLLAGMPRLEREPMDPRMAALAWKDDRAALQAWRDGLTGYPVVDAAIRQLTREGWLPNRARLIVASFLTKDLGISWQAGERVFMDRLLDGDLASNNGGWQWVAGTGADPLPFFRVFNPVLQGQRFDPQGVYVRRWCPELSGLPDSRIHQPWLLDAAEQRRGGCLIGRDYPGPIVDHPTARRAALARVAALPVTTAASGASPRSRAKSSLSPRA